MFTLYSETETVTVTGLQPFTEYKFSVFSSSNTALYNITSCRTLEGCKLYFLTFTVLHQSLWVCKCMIGKEPLDGHCFFGFGGFSEIKRRLQQTFKVRKCRCESGSNSLQLMSGRGYWSFCTNCSQRFHQPDKSRKLNPEFNHYWNLWYVIWVSHYSTVVLFLESLYWLLWLCID